MSPPMTVDEFIAAQQEVIAEGDFNDYLPTLWIETARQMKVNVLTDPPDGQDLERVARDWARQMARKHDYFLAFKADDSRLKVVARIDGVQDDRIMPLAAR
jgi:hypothetical protein